MNKRILIGVVGLVIALIGVFGANVYVRKSLQEVEVMTVKKEVPAYTEITGDMLAAKTVVSSGLDAGVVRDSKHRK